MRQQQTANSKFRTLRGRLLLSSLSVISVTLGIAAISVHQFIAHSLSQKLDRQLALVADAAAHSLATIKANRNTVHIRAVRRIDNDGDLDIPWQDLQQNQQGIEWFDAEGQLLAKAGKYFSTEPLVLKSHTAQANGIRTLVISTYIPKQPQVKPILQGYVRVSELTEATREELERLRWGLASGGFVALIFCGAGSWWLTRQSLQPIEMSFQQLKQFTADASHELRNPLTVIKTSVEVIQSHPEQVHPATVTKLAGIASATIQMTQLVEDLLLLARTDGNPAGLRSTWVSIPIDELLEDIIDWFFLQAKAKQIVLKANLGAGEFVRGNVGELKRLFSNLVANALQYTAIGGTVTVASASLDDWVVIKVEDTGIGIAPDHLPLVFDRFWRSDQARSQQEGGLGLGLAIVQGIARSHQGKITVSSRLGVGSCFQVHLPTGS